MTKEEKIKEAYGEHWEEINEFVFEDGYFDKSRFYELKHYVPKIDFTKFDENEDSLIRPKSLQEIEHNNGWIKIESEEDLPKEELDCHFIFKQNDKKYQTFGVWDNKLKSFWSGALRINYVTHYQPIKKPEPPIY